MTIQRFFTDIRRRKTSSKSQKPIIADKFVKLRGLARSDRLNIRKNWLKTTSKKVQDSLKGDGTKEGVITKLKKPLRKLTTKVSLKALKTNLSPSRISAKFKTMDKQKLIIGIAVLTVLAIGTNYAIRRKAQTTLTAVGKLL